MQQHYILKIDPQADCEWERCIIRNPLTGEHPDFKKAIAKTLPNLYGSYLIKVSIDVEVLESTNSKNSPSVKHSTTQNNPLPLCQTAKFPAVSPVS